MTNKELRKLQLVELEILIEVTRICEENDIEYFLFGGTALGAKRHSGFIPWDDDIDIGMLRSEYDRFLKIAPQKIDKNYFLQNNKTDPKCPFLLTKIRKNDTKFVEWSKRNISMHQGIYIDIFPFDNAPEDSVKQKTLRKQFDHLYNIYLLKTIPDRSSCTNKSFKWYIIAVFRRLLHYLMILYPLSKLVNKLDVIFTKYNYIESDIITCYLANQIYYSKSKVLPTEVIEFEGHSFSCLRNLDLSLKIQYGDYMQLPPVEKRIGHFPSEIVIK